MTIPKIHTQFDPPHDEGIKNDLPSLTRQEFLEETDINNILDQYETSGVIPESRPGEPQYADLTDPIFTDYQRAQNIVIDAQYAFERIPAAIRERFNNDPASFIAFLQDEKNREEADKLGLLRPDWRPKPVATPPAAPVAEPPKAVPPA